MPPISIHYQFLRVYPANWAKIGVDASKDEIYVVSSTKVKIFNENGMEVFSFNEGAELGMVTDVAVDERTGDIFVVGIRQHIAVQRSSAATFAESR